MKNSQSFLPLAIIMQKSNSQSLLKFSLLGNLLCLLLGIGVIFWMGGWKHFVSKLKNRGLSEEYAMQGSQMQLLESDTTSLLFLGNSLIANGHWQEWFPTEKVINRGIRGDGIEGVKMRMSNIVALHPAQLFLMIGINDLAFHPSSWVIHHYDLLLEEIKKQLPHTKVWVQSILPVNNSVKETGHSNKTIALTNKELAEIAESKGFSFIDLHPLFANEAGALKEEWTLDGIHLTGEAYKSWSDFLKKVFMKTDKFKGQASE